MFKKILDHKSIIKVDNIEFGGDHVPVIAGPNTVESLELILNVHITQKNAI